MLRLFYVTILFIESFRAQPARAFVPLALVGVLLSALGSRAIVSAALSRATPRFLPACTGIQIVDSATTLPERPVSGISHSDHIRTSLCLPTGFTRA
jgi:hypothetical protein